MRPVPSAPQVDGRLVTVLPVELRVEVTPRWAFHLPGRGGGDGVLRRRGHVLERLLHIGGRPAIVRVAQTGPRRVLFGAWANDRDDAEQAIAQASASNATGRRALRSHGRRLSLIHI